MNRAAKLGLILVLTSLAPVPYREKDAAIGKSYQIPYRLTETNHYLVRVRINGKGPFNFLVDSGAPALYVGTEAAKAINLGPANDSYWTPISRLDLEGGASLMNVKARVEDPFQLTGMNALGLPGASIDGILGFTVLARFRMEFDPTKDRMTWTRVDYEPKEPFIPREANNRKGGAAPPEVQAMQLMGPMMKIFAVFLGKQPEEQRYPHGTLGLELRQEDGLVRVMSVLPKSAAAKADIRAGDVLMRVLETEPADVTTVHNALAKTRPGANVQVQVRRGEEVIERVITAMEGL
jgi:hypothetical protein